MILESVIQRKLINYLEKQGFLVVKTIVLNVSGYPDIFAFRNGEALFVEVKSKNGKLSELQEYRIKKIREQGFKVLIVNDLKTLINFIEK